MKTYFLENIANVTAAEDWLTRLLPGQSHPWLLMSDSEDPIAYFSLDGQSVQADISGRHFNQDKAVLSTLEALREHLGGTICDDAGD